MTRKILAALLLSAALGAACFSSRGVIALDFRAFYCAGWAFNQGGNPYHTEPLYDCERHRTDSDYAHLIPNAALPAPVPGYDIAAFGLLAHMPFAMAKLLWGAILGMSMAIAVLVLVRLSRMPPAVVLAVLSTALVAPSLALGQIVPLYFAAASATMMFVSVQRYRYAALAASASLVEPHLGLPICIGLALWIPQSRVTLALAAGVLCTVGIAALGFAQNVEYFTAVLPLHALSELSSDSQLSLSAVLHALDFGDGTAIRVGAMSYVLGTIAGAYLGGRVAKRLRNSAFVVAVPAATSLIGGAYLHGTDVVAAIPLVLLLFIYGQTHRLLNLSCLVLLSAPLWAVWQAPSDVAAWFVFAGFSALYVIWRLGHVGAGIASLCAVTVFAGLLILSISYHSERERFLQQPHPVAVAIASEYPEATWGRVNREMFSAEGGAVWLSRLFTWFGLVVAVGGALDVVRSRRQLQATA